MAKYLKKDKKYPSKRVIRTNVPIANKRKGRVGRKKKQVKTLMIVFNLSSLNDRLA
jgi:hypothetical protein